VLFMLMCVGRGCLSLPFLGMEKPIGCTRSSAVARVTATRLSSPPRRGACRACPPPTQRARRAARAADATRAATARRSAVVATPIPVPCALPPPPRPPPRGRPVPPHDRSLSVPLDVTDEDDGVGVEGDDSGNDGDGDGGAGDGDGGAGDGDGGTGGGGGGGVAGGDGGRGVHCAAVPRSQPSVQMHAPTAPGQCVQWAPVDASGGGGSDACPRARAASRHGESMGASRRRALGMGRLGGVCAVGSRWGGGAPGRRWGEVSQRRRGEMHRDDGWLPWPGGRCSRFLGPGLAGCQQDTGAAAELPVERNEAWQGHDVMRRQVTKVAGRPPQCMAAYGLHTTRRCRGRLAATDWGWSTPPLARDRAVWGSRVWSFQGPYKSRACMPPSS